MLFNIVLSGGAGVSTRRF